MALDKLFSPFSIGTLNLENRLVMPPMATNYASPEGFVTERQIDYYVERARGGAGYLNVEHTGILPQGKASPKMLLISSDEHALHMSRLVNAVHEAGGKIVVQINHAGRQTFSTVTGSPVVGPSPIPALPVMETPRELSVEEIETLLIPGYMAGVGHDFHLLHLGDEALLLLIEVAFVRERQRGFGLL